MTTRTLEGTLSDVLGKYEISWRYVQATSTGASGDTIHIVQTGGACSRGGDTYDVSVQFDDADAWSSFKIDRDEYRYINFSDFNLDEDIDEDTEAADALDASILALIEREVRAELDDGWAEDNASNDESDDDEESDDDDESSDEKSAENGADAPAGSVISLVHGGTLDLDNPDAVDAYLENNKDASPDPNCCNSCKQLAEELKTVRLRKMGIKVA
jgi:hypothetical protein